MNPDIDSLISDISFWEAIGICASIAVIIGIGIESWEIFKIFKHGKFKEKWFEVIGAILVVVGLSMEILSQIKANDKNGYVIAALKAKAADANKIAQQAAQKAGELGISVGTLTQNVTGQKAKIESITEDLNANTDKLNAANVRFKAAIKTQADLEKKLRVAEENNEKLMKENKFLKAAVAAQMGSGL
jgi:exonuclease VII small subunit